MGIMYIVHFKNGTTKVVNDGEPGAPYPEQLDTREVSSIERVIDGRVYTIKNHPDIDSFFVKTTAQVDFNPFTTTRTEQITERILGCVIGDHILELIITPHNGHCKLTISKNKL